eukprot:3191261-Rhodomonas_salina.1
MHVTEDCPAVTVPCRMYKGGCKWRGQQGDRDHHVFASVSAHNSMVSLAIESTEKEITKYKAELRAMGNDLQFNIQFDSFVKKPELYDDEEVAVEGVVGGGDFFSCSFSGSSSRSTTTRRTAA